MDQLRKLLAALNLRQRITIVVAALAVVAAVMGLSSWHRESDFKALYTSLAPEDAAAIIQKLKEAGTEYRVSENGTAVLAPSARVAELRLDLAAAGLPRTGRIGYELFDKTNLGATEFTEHLNFHRALEGELERSIQALSAIEQARVHITFPKESVFLDSRQPAKASVLLKIRPGSHLSPQNIAAVTNLVASAVEGLGPEAVSVLDMNGNLLNRPHAPQSDDQPSEATIEYRKNLESDLLAKVNATLEPLLGPDKFKAGISLDCDFTSGEQSDESVDPTKSVMVTSQKSEEQTGSALASGQPGTASTLPRPTSRPGSGGSSGVSRRTENITFQTSRVIRHVKLPQGVIKRMSISVLVDQTAHMEGKGSKAKRVLTPPSAETMKAIRDLVSAVTGFSADRGDQFVLESLPFESTQNFQPEPPAIQVQPDARVPKFLQPFVKDFNTLLFYGAVAVAGLGFLAVVLFLLMKMGKGPSAESNKAIAAGAEGPKAHTAEEVEARIEAALSGQQEKQRALQLEQEDAMLNSLAIPIATTKKAEVLIKHLRENIAKDVEATTNVFRSWMSDADKNA